MKKLLKKEQGPAETPKYLYFIGYILFKASVIKRKNSKFLCFKTHNVFMDRSIELDKVNLVQRYKNVFRKGSFRSITPELLFETVAFYTMNALEIKGFFYSFTELRDYFIIDYAPFFFFFDYLQIYPTFLSEDSFDNLDSNILFSNTDEFYYNINFLFSKHNSLLKIVDINPGVIDLYSYYIDLNNIIGWEFYSVYYLYYYVETLSELSDLFDLNNFIGFNFYCELSLQGTHYVENSLFTSRCLFVDNSIFKSNYLFDIYNITEDITIFVFSIYISFLYFSQYDFYTDYDFRYISTNQAQFKQINSYLKHQGLFL